MNPHFEFIFSGLAHRYSTLVHSGLYRSGIRHGFISNQLDLKVYDLNRPFYLDGTGDISLAKQVHGVKVLKSSDYGKEGDAFIVREGEICGIRTADCVPLILVDRLGKVGAVVHAGWLGACAGVLEETLNELRASGVDFRDLIALIGPSAQACCYEVGSEVAGRFESGVEHRGDKNYLSIPVYMGNVLLQAGLNEAHIHNTKHCTICSEDYFSYRKNGDNAGRFLSFLAL